MPSMKNGRVELRSLSAPDSVHPGDTFTAAIVAVNHESVIFNDPDGCSNGNNPCRGTDGYCIRGDVSIGEQSNSKNFCLNLPFSGIPPNTERIAFDMQAPAAEGDYNVSAVLNAPASGESTDALTSTVSVTQRADRGHQNPGDSGSGAGGSQIKGGRVSFDGIVLPDVPAMQPGTSFEIGVVGTNHASFIVNDPDGCSVSGTDCEGTVDGYCIDSNVWVADGGGQTATSCLNLPFSGTGSKTETTVLLGTTPTTPGEYNVEANIQANNSGEQTDHARAAFSVSEDAPPPENGSVYKLPADGGEKPDLLPEIPREVKLGVGLLLLVWGLSSVANISESVSDVAE